MSEELICQNVNHPSEITAHGQVSISFWYGSKNDLKQGTINLCDDCGEKAIAILTKEFGVKDFLKPIEEF